MAINPGVLDGLAQCAGRGKKVFRSKAQACTVHQGMDRFSGSVEGAMVRKEAPIFTVSKRAETCEIFVTEHVAL